MASRYPQSLPLADVIDVFGIIRGGAAEVAAKQAVLAEKAWWVIGFGSKRTFGDPPNADGTLVAAQVAEPTEEERAAVNDFVEKACEHLQIAPPQYITLGGGGRLAKINWAQVLKIAAMVIAQLAESAGG